MAPARQDTPVTLTPARRDPQNQASDAIEKSADKEEALFSKFAALTGDRGKEDDGKNH
jgi:hypothetical protein